MKPFLFTILCVVGILSGALNVAISNEADDESLPSVNLITSNNLQSDGTLSHQKQLPILIMFAQQGCSYCHVIEEEFLKPMLRNRDYDSKVIIRRVMLDNYAAITGFNGKPITGGDLATQYGAGFTPTVVFLDHKGNQIAPKIIGLTTVDFYGGDLDNAIEQSLSRLRNLALTDPH